MAIICPAPTHPRFQNHPLRFYPHPPALPNSALRRKARTRSTLSESQSGKAPPLRVAYRGHSGSSCPNQRSIDQSQAEDPKLPPLRSFHGAGRSFLRTENAERCLGTSLQTEPHGLIGRFGGWMVKGGLCWVDLGCRFRLRRSAVTADDLEAC